MRKYVLKLPHIVISSNIASVILVLKISKTDQTEDFLSILKPSEITKIHQKWIEKSQYNHGIMCNYFLKQYFGICYKF